MHLSLNMSWQLGFGTRYVSLIRDRKIFSFLLFVHKTDLLTSGRFLIFPCPIRGENCENALARRSFVGKTLFMHNFFYLFSLSGKFFTASLCILRLPPIFYNFSPPEKDPQEVRKLSCLALKTSGAENMQRIVSKK